MIPLSYYYSVVQTAAENKLVEHDVSFTWLIISLRFIGVQKLETCGCQIVLRTLRWDAWRFPFPCTGELVVPFLKTQKFLCLLFVVGWGSETSFDTYYTFLFRVKLHRSFWWCSSVPRFILKLMQSLDLEIISLATNFLYASHSHRVVHFERYQVV